MSRARRVAGWTAGAVAAGVANGLVNLAQLRNYGVADLPAWWPPARETIWWLVAAACAPLLFAVARRVPFLPGRVLAPLAAQAAAVAALAGPATVVTTAAVRALLPPGPAEAPHWWQWVPALQFEPSSFALVWSIALVGWHAVAAARRASARAADGARLQADLARARVDVLRLQTEPAFVGATIDAVERRLRDGHVREARRLVTRLGDVLRLSLEEDRGPVPLRRELAFVETWMEVQRIRLGDRLTLSVDVEPAARAAALPALLLQPLLDDMARTALAAADRCALRLSARVADGRLRVALGADVPGVSVGDAARAAAAERLAHAMGPDVRVAAGPPLRIDAPFRPAPGGDDDDEGEETWR